MSDATFRLRINYTKEERLRYLSHLEVIRCLERCIRRAGLPFAVTQGFSPHMRSAFGWALGVGIASVDEYLDVWLTEYVPAEDAVAAFDGVLPRGIRILGACYVGNQDKSLTEEYPCARYECVFEVGEEMLDEANEAMAKLLEIGQILVIRKKKEKVVKFEGLLTNKPTFEVREDGRLAFEMLTFTEGKGALRSDLFCAELIGICPALGPVSITRTEQFSD